MTIKFGIMQGRLTKTRNNVLQKFPKYWKKEFKYLDQTNLEYIEFFTENKKNIKNPIWNNQGVKEIKKKLPRVKYKRLILCDNFSVDNLIIKKETKKYLFNLIERLRLFKDSKLIIPILLKKKIKKNTFYKYLSAIKEIINYSKKNKVKVSFEFDTNIKVIKKFCDKFSNNKNFFITYDTGNAYVISKNFYKEILILRKFVDHIHLKDRDNLGNNIVLGQGKINFDLFFRNLNKHKKYNGTITFETNRGINPIKTASSNLRIIKNFL